jgi:acyl-CoA thioesterase
MNHHRLQTFSHHMKVGGLQVSSFAPSFSAIFREGESPRLKIIFHVLQRWIGRVWRSGTKFKFISGDCVLIRMGYFEEVRLKGRDANPFLRLMAIDIDSFDNGEAQLSLEVRPEMLNGAGWLQGGLFTALCDEAMALALFTVLEKDEGIATISESTSYLEGVRNGRVTATGKVIKKGHSVAFTEGCVKKTDDATVLSQTRASFAVMRGRKSMERSS